MSLFQTIKLDQLQARKTKESLKVTLLTTLIGEIQTELKSSNKDEDEVTLDTLLKFIKSANQSQALRFTDSVEEELNILKQYTPQPLSDASILKIINTAKSYNSDFGTIMKVFSTKYKGRYDAKSLASIVKQQLNSV